jgi:2C-methyl-D-erythritol 2,4-cyclodiphosphate synthase
VVAEQPRLASHLKEMTANLTSALAPCGGAVSVRPKRAEGLGALGRSEGIAAWAVALLEQSAED